MITSTIFRSRRNRLVTLLMLMGSIFFLASYVDGAYEHYFVRENELRLVSTHTVPLREISALTGKQDEDGLWKVYAIGEKSQIIKEFKFDAKLESLQMKHHIDFSQPLLDRFAICTSDSVSACHSIRNKLSSEWEAVATDEFGHFFLLNEVLASIVVYHHPTEKITGVINLEYFDMRPAKQVVHVQHQRHHYKRSNNAMGEGMVFLENGHILIAKQRMSSGVIEFGPAGEEPSGFHAAPVGKDRPFPLKDGRVSLVPLHIWKLDERFESCEVNQMNTDAEGAIYLLSETCSWIGKLKPLQTAENRVAVEKRWYVPRKIHRSEGFVVLGKDGFLVASDLKSKKGRNVFHLGF
jgi:hypothetical protein